VRLLFPGFVAALFSAAFLAACDSKPLDWNQLSTARIRDLVPGAQVTVLDAKTLKATAGAKSLDIDTAELQVRCGRGPKDCDRAFEDIALQLRGPEPQK
jgi:hypothetical protein